MTRAVVGRAATVVVLVSAAVMILPALATTSFSMSIASEDRYLGTPADPQAGAGNLHVPSLLDLDSSTFVIVPDHEPGVDASGAAYLGSGYVPSMHVVVTMSLANQSRLSQLLADLSNPQSPLYHHYITASQFRSEFSPASSGYDLVVGYISSFEIRNLATFADRSTIAFDAPSTVIETMFHTHISRFRLGDIMYYAPSVPPKFPSTIASLVSSVEGLSSYATDRVLGGTHVVSSHSHPLVPVSLHPAAGYLSPVIYKGVQLEYGPDLQVTYDEQALFYQYGYPTDEVVATILWSGVYLGNGTAYCSGLTKGQSVGPFVPSDISDYFNETLPSGEPHPQAYGVPISGAPPPGKMASCDSTLTHGENTLDLEMVGSLAPGSSIYNVYGPTPSPTYTDQAFATILNGGTGIPAALSNVSVISNSWGGTETNDTSWYQDLEQAQTRGITVLAGTGDSGDDPSSPLPNMHSSFPEAMAYNTFGDTAVGGTNVTVGGVSARASFLHLLNNSAWYNRTGHTGSAGGLSTIFPEPSWQLSTQANKVVGGTWRGSPDIAAIANNTLVTGSISGFEFIATNATNGGPFITLWGNSIATPVEAGIAAEIDHVLKMNSQGPLGYMNPDLYLIANLEYGKCPQTPTTGCQSTGAYNSSLPTLPLMDSYTMGNYAYRALVGYDLVTGWGSIDAYNFTMYFLTVSSAGQLGKLSGVDNMLNLTGLKVTSTGGNYNASIQQNFFLANSLGAPVYWVQNVIYVNHTSKGWAMDFTGWVIYPFYPIYPNLTIYEYNWPLAVPIVNTPVSFNIVTNLSQGSGFNGQTVTYSFGDGQPSLSLPVPGASYIIGSRLVNFTWQGLKYTLLPGFASPQFGLVGGPSLGTGNYQSPTAGTMYSTLRPWGSTRWIAAATSAFATNITQTGEVAQNLGWTYTGNPGSWSIGISAGSNTQGVFSYDPRTSAGIPTISSFSASPNPVTVGSTTSFAVAVTGGATPYSYAYAGLPSGCSSSNTNSLSCTPTAAGTFNVAVTVTDMNGYAATRSTSLTVNGVASGPTISAFSASPNPVTVNSPSLFSTAVSGGTTPYTYVYTGLPTGCASSNTNSLSCTPTATGTFNVTVTVTDANSKTASKSTTLTVNPASVPTVTAFSASPNPVTVNTATTFSATVSGGTTPYSYAYTGLPAGCASSNTNSLSCTPTATGTFNVTVTVTDAGTKTATKSAQLAVSPSTSGNPTVTSFTANPNPVIENQQTTLSVSVAGGTTPYSYSYTGLPPGCASSSVATLTCTPTATGSFTIGITVADASGKTATSSVTLTVTASSSGNPNKNNQTLFFGLGETTFLLLIGLVAAVALILAALLIISRRNRGPGAVPMSAAPSGPLASSSTPAPQLATATAPLSTVPQAPSQPIVQTSYCSECGSKVETESSFCIDCGSKL